MNRSYTSNIERYGNSNDPDIIYYNADIIDGKQTNSIAYNDDQLIKFQEQRQTPILNKADDYEFSIIKFSLNGPNKNLPLWIPQISIGQSNINLTAYTLGFKLTITYPAVTTNLQTTYTTYVSTPMIYVPQDSIYSNTSNGIENGPLPTAPLTTQDLTSSYYYVYSYDHFVTMLNTTLLTAYNALNTAFSAFYTANGSTITIVTFTYVGTTVTLNYTALSNIPFIVGQSITVAGTTTVDGTFTVLTCSTTQLTYTKSTGANGSGGTVKLSSSITSKVPYCTYEANGLFNLYYDCYGFGGSDARSSGAEALTLYFNNNLVGLLSSFDTTFVLPSSVNTLNTNECNELMVFNKLNTNIWIPNTYNFSTSPTLPYSFPTLAGAYYKMAQNFICTSTLWSPCASIVFTSLFLPVVREYVSASINIGQSNDKSLTTTNNFSPVISDVTLNSKSASDYLNLIFYEPSGEYRMSSLSHSSVGAISDIDIQVFWRNRLDNQLYPLRMYNNSSVSLKILFRKKKY